MHISKDGGWALWNTCKLPPRIITVLDRSGDGGILLITRLNTSYFSSPMAYFTFLPRPMFLCSLFSYEGKNQHCGSSFSTSWPHGEGLWSGKFITPISFWKCTGTLTVRTESPEMLYWKQNRVSRQALWHFYEEKSEKHLVSTY